MKCAVQKKRRQHARGRESAIAEVAKDANAGDLLQRCAAFALRSLPEDPALRALEGVAPPELPSDHLLHSLWNMP